MTRVFQWNQETDVLIAGSGGAGLTAAIMAHDRGAKALVVERSGYVGGTTAVSGGALWTPMNHHMKELGIEDSREEALAYCKHLTAGRADDALVKTHIDTGCEVVRYLEEHTPLKLAAVSMPDYHPEEEGGKLGGRSIEPTLFDTKQLGQWTEKLRGATAGFVVTVQELFTTYRAYLKPQNLPMDIILDRAEKGLVTCGPALIGMLLKGCLDRDTTILLETRALELIREDGRILGVRAERNGKDLFIRAKAVVLACGGYEWNEHLKAKFLPGPVTHPSSPPLSEGDGLVMAMEAGADLANMSEAWWAPSVVIPGQEYEGRQLSRLLLTERIAPHTVLVNRYGQRFVNESANYNDMPKAFYHFDANAYEYRNLPCWLIFDAQYREKYVVMGVAPSDPDPDWLARDGSLAGLAQNVGIDPSGLEATMARFNGIVREGKDRDFGRGDSAYDRYMGDVEAPHPNLGTIQKPPFYAVPVYPGALGTKGGPRTNTKGQVLHVRGHPIPGLYAAGNAMAGVSGPGYYGGGATVGLSIVWGYICGINAAQEALAGQT